MATVECQYSNGTSVDNQSADAVVSGGDAQILEEGLYVGGGLAAGRDAVVLVLILGRSTVQMNLGGGERGRLEVPAPPNGSHDPNQH